MEAQSLRALNLELMAKYGVESWKAAVGDLTALAGAGRARGAALDAASSAVNAARQAPQEAAAPRLKALVGRTRG